MSRLARVVIGGVKNRKEWLGLSPWENSPIFFEKYPKFSKTIFVFLI